MAESKVEYKTNESTATHGLITEKEKIATGGEYNLSGERYRERVRTNTRWPMISLSMLADIESGSRQKGGAVSSGIPSIGGEQIDEKGNIRFDKMKYVSEGHFRGMKKGVLKNGDVLVVKDGATTGKTGFFSYDLPASVNEHVFILRAKETVRPYYLYSIIRSDVFQECLSPFIQGIIGGISLEIREIQIPLPPLEVQREIVAEIEGYQRVIDGARAVVDNYRPQIVVDPEWPTEELSEVAIKITDGTHTTPNYTDSGIPFLRVTDITKSNTSKKFISEEEHTKLIKRCHPEKGDVLYSKNGTIGIAKVVDWEEDFSIFVSLALIKPRRELVDSRYLEYFLNSDTAYEQAISRSKSGTVTNLHLVDIKTIKIPLPTLETQQAIVAEIEAEQSLVAANRELIERMEGKIQAAIGRVWGEDKTKGS